MAVLLSPVAVETPRIEHKHLKTCQNNRTRSGDDTPRYKPKASKATKTEVKEEITPTRKPAKKSGE